MSAHVAPYDETMGILRLFHSHVEVDFPPFVGDFHHETKVTLNWEAFVFALVHSPRLHFNGLSGTVYKVLQNYFVPNDFMSGFNLFFKVCGHIV
jgi:hypothetical protein